MYHEWINSQIHCGDEPGANKVAGLGRVRERLYPADTSSIGLLDDEGIRVDHEGLRADFESEGVLCVAGNEERL